MDPSEHTPLSSHIIYGCEGPIAFTDEDFSFDDSNEDFENLKYFKDEESESNGSNEDLNNIGNAILAAKGSNVKKLRKKVQEDLAKCTISAEIEAENWRTKMLSLNPVNSWLTKHPNLNHINFEDLIQLKKDLQTRITSGNTELLNLIETKDNLEQRRDESMADVKDLMSIM